MESKGSLAASNDPNHLVAMIGCEDMVVVHTPDDVPDVIAINGDWVVKHPRDKEAYVIKDDIFKANYMSELMLQHIHHETPLWF